MNNPLVALEWSLQSARRTDGDGGWTCGTCKEFKTWDELVEESYAEDRDDLFKDPICRRCHIRWIANGFKLPPIFT